jgi:hypothetical protein
MPEVSPQKNALLLLRRWGFWVLLLSFTACISSQESRKIDASGIKPYWLKQPLAQAITVVGEAADSTEALRNAFYQARTQLIDSILRQHAARMQDSLLSATDYQYHYRSYLLRKTEEMGFTGIQLGGFALDSSRIRNRYYERRYDPVRGRNFYRYYLHLHWHDSLTAQLADAFFAIDKGFSDVLQTAAYYLEYPTDLSMLDYQLQRLETLPALLEDYRGLQAEMLIEAYQRQYEQLELKAVNVGPDHFDLLLVLNDRHMLGSNFVYDSNNCVKLELKKEDEAGFRFKYDESLCPAAANYPISLALLLPGGRQLEKTLALPGNRVVMKTSGPLILHYFEDSQDGYAEMYVKTISGQSFYLRELHFNGHVLNLAVNGVGRSITGAKSYQLRAPIPATLFKKILKEKSSTANGGLVYTHPTSGIEIDYCFEGVDIQLKKYK